MALAKLEHARALGYCSKGIRKWFEGREYSWRDFVAHGVPTEWLRATGDAMAIRVAEEAEKDERQRRQGQ